MELSSNGEVTLFLPETTDCGTRGALCVSDCRMISNEPDDAVGARRKGKIAKLSVRYDGKCVDRVPSDHSVSRQHCGGESNCQYPGWFPVCS